VARARLLRRLLEHALLQLDHRRASSASSSERSCSRSIGAWSSVSTGSVSGSTKRQVPGSETWLARRARPGCASCRNSGLPGSGAAGGLAGGLAALGAELVPGLELVAEEVGLDRALAGVTLVIANTGLCSGVLLNNVAGDGTPYVLTARHCENGNADGGNPSAASGVSAYFDAVTPCGQVLASIFDTETAVLTGAVTMVEQQDAWLIRFDGPIPVTDAYFSGWDATGAAFVGGYTAHYGLGNSRQYTGWYGQAYFDHVTAAALGVHYASTFWDLVNQVGSVAPGASGSGVFDANNRLVGTLVRAQAQDSTPNSPGVCPVLTPPAPGPATATVSATAFSGIFDSTADPQSTTGAATLRTVLDPQNTGLLTLNGKWMPPRFSANSSTSPTGSPVILNWNAPGATSCTASGGQAGDGWSGSLAASGSQSVTEYAAGAVTYFLTCNSGSAQSTANAAITWTLAAPTATLQVATGSNGFLNNPIQLTWSSTVSPCVASGGNTGDGWTGTVAANGTQTVNETTAGSYTYIITCGSGSRSATAQFRVTFVAPVVTLQDGGITSANIGQPITLTGSGAGTNCANSGGSSGDGWLNTNLIANGGTFTLTNSGIFGEQFGTPIINQPQSAILGIGGLNKEAEVITDKDGNDSIAIRSIQRFTLGFDHRIVDGADAGKFMSDFKAYLENWSEDIG